MFDIYRPVFMLCSLSKVFEKIMYTRLLSYLNEHKILFSYQFGLRESHSTYMALMVLMDKWSKTLDDENMVIGVLLDFSKAFDMVDHDILLFKLSHYGIRDNAQLWFKSYLSNRNQFVTYGVVRSLLKTIKCGVPQYWDLCCFLFILMICAMFVAIVCPFYLLMTQIFLQLVKNWMILRKCFFLFVSSFLFYFFSSFL